MKDPLYIFDAPENAPQRPLDAASWVVRLYSDQVVQADDLDFEAWRNESPLNEAEFEAHEQIWRSIGNLSGNAEAREILAETRSPMSWRRARTLLVGTLMAAAAFAGFMIMSEPVIREELYQTARGERKDIILSDGSAVTLNTNSVLRVTFKDNERRVVLDRGEFFVAVAKDSQRPFRVFVEDREVRALGTAFDVYRDDVDDKAGVIIEHGVVGIYRIEPEEDGIVRRMKAHVVPEVLPDAPLAVLKPGQHAMLVRAAAPNIVAVDVAQNTSWRNGLIVFEKTSLRDAVKEVNRYRNRQIIIGSDSLVELKVSGVFHIDNFGDAVGDRFIESLIASFPIRIEREDANTTLITAR